jgi:hypothetical protein
MEIIIVKNLTLTTMVDFLNDRFKFKNNGSKFQITDAQQYITRGKLPQYLGNFEVVKNENISSVKLYNILEKVEND